MIEEFVCIALNPELTTEIISGYRKDGYSVEIVSQNVLVQHPGGVLVITSLWKRKGVATYDVEY